MPSRIAAAVAEAMHPRGSVESVIDASTRYLHKLSAAEMRSGITRRLLVNTFAAAESDFSRRVRRVLRGKGRESCSAPPL